MTRAPSRVSACWDCGALSPWRRIVVESVIHSRSKAEGGPYRTYQCPGCRIDVGALHGPLGGWLLHPLSGLAEPGLLDRLLPAAERRALDRAHRWWTANALDVERFRRGLVEFVGAPPDPARAAAHATEERTARRGSPPPSSPPPSSPRPSSPRPSASTRKRAPPPRPERPRTPPPAPSPPRTRPPRPADPLRAALGVSAEAGLPEIRRAYRVLAKRWHPDRVGGDAAAQRDAAGRFREIRAAYEALVAEMS